MKKNFTLIIALMATALFYAQDTFPPTIVSQGTFLGESAPLRDAALVPEFTGDVTDAYRIDQRFTYEGGLTNNGSPDGFDPLVQTEPPLHSPRGTGINIEAINIGQSGGAIPPDPSGAVGPDHYVVAVNSAVKIFDKAGNTLQGPLSLNSVFGISGNGDPIVMYDQLADRFFISQFRVSNNALLMAVSTTADPTGSYYVYQYPLSSFPDYPHYSVWPDAYYLTANKSGQNIYVFDRHVMLAGGEDPALQGFVLPGVIPNPATVYSPEPANLLGRITPVDVPGYVVYLQDDAWSGVTNDHVKIWTVDVDFDNASSISTPQEIPVQPFDSFFQGFGQGDISQPGTSQRIDAISGVISYMANYRTFENHNSLLINFNTDLGSLKSGIRWIELRNTGNGAFSIFQEGTYSIADDVSRFMGSMSMDKDGNMALAYNVSGSTTFPGIRFTGRLVDDPLSTMTFPEEVIIDGEGGVGTFNRFGDYAQMTMDVNNLTFWYTGEYFGATNNFWKVRLANMELGSPEADDLAVYGFEIPLYEGPFSATETIQARVANFGTNSQSGFEIELRVNDVLITSDTFTGSLAPGETAVHEFSTTIDMEAPGTYDVAATTVLAGDSYDANDTFVYTYETLEILGLSDQDFVTRELLIYPTTDRNYEIFLATENDFGTVDYTIYDNLGKQIMNGTLAKESNGYKTEVNMNTKAAGIYIVKINNDVTTLSKKILVR